MGPRLVPVRSFMRLPAPPVVWSLPDWLSLSSTAPAGATSLSSTDGPRFPRLHSSKFQGLPKVGDQRRQKPPAKPSMGAMVRRVYGASKAMMSRHGLLAACRT
jgi:hypothetical protein